MTYPDNRIAALERRIEELEAKYERLETIASMQPEPQHGDVRVGTAANDLSQALIVDGEAIPPGCVPPPLEGPLGDDPCIDLSGEAPATVGQQVVEGLQELVDVIKRGEAIGAHFKITERSPDSAAAYWREQWEKMHAEVVSLRVESHEWKTKYESQCRGVKSYLEQIDSLRAQLKQRSDQHWTCNGCGFSWNADPLPERDEHGYRVSPIKCKACECESLRAQLAAKEDIGSALAEARRQIQSYEIAIEKHNKKMASITQHGRPETVQEGLRFLAQWFDDLYEDKGTGRDEVQRDLRRWANEIDAQLAARPVVTATDEQVKALVHDICSGEWHPAVAQSIRSWLSTLGVVQTKQVEAWVAGDRLPLNGEVYALPTSAVLRCATFHHEEPSKARVLVRKTLNVVQEPNNANPV